MSMANRKRSNAIKYFYIKCDNLLDKHRDEYDAILKEAFINHIRIIAITDHNTVDGYFDLIEKMNNNPERFKKYIDILILPGIEISCFGKHFLAIFPNDKSKEELSNLLFNVGIEANEQGREDSDAYKVTPIELMKKISLMGGITILAHADSTNGLLENLIHKKNYEPGEWILKGKGLAKIVQSEYLNGISINDKSIKYKLENDILNNRAFKRDKKLAIMYFSDSHGTKNKIGEYSSDGKSIGSRYSYIKLSELTFHGLNISLQDPEVRIFDEIPTMDYPIIEGVAIEGGFIGVDSDGNSPQVIRFNKSLNCVIGARGAGKSTLLDVIQYVLYYNQNNVDTACKFDEAVVFLNYRNQRYAFVRKSKTEKNDYTEDVEDISRESIIYRMSKTGNFNRVKKDNSFIQEVNSFSSVAYKQRELFNFSIEKDGPTEVIDNLMLINNKSEYVRLTHQLDTCFDSVNQIIKNIPEFEWKDLLENYESEDEEIEKLIEEYTKILDEYSNLNDMRMSILSRINKTLKGQVLLTLNKDYTNVYRVIEEIIQSSRAKHNLVAEDMIVLSSRLKYLLDKAKKENLRWIFPVCVLNNDIQLLSEYYSIDEESSKEIIKLVRPIFKKSYVLEIPRDIVEFSYNVNMGISKNESFLGRNKLSMGQKAVAMLLIVVTAAHDLGDNRPLIIDQPEDDLDNIYIYSSLVKEFRKVKNSRQLLFATHNPNIPISGDAENILILESNGRNGLIKSTGSIDRIGISKNVLNILEGGSEALALRNLKYPSK